MQFEFVDGSLGGWEDRKVKVYIEDMRLEEISEEGLASLIKDGSTAPSFELDGVWNSEVTVRYSGELGFDVSYIWGCIENEVEPPTDYELDYFDPEEFESEYSGVYLTGTARVRKESF